LPATEVHISQSSCVIKLSKMTFKTLPVCHQVFVFKTKRSLILAHYLKDTTVKLQLKKKVSGDQ